MKISKFFLFTCTLIPGIGSAQLQKLDLSFWQPNGPVYTVETDSVNDKVYVGGEFQFFSLPRSGMISVDTGKTTVNENFPQSKGNLNAIVPDGSGGFYVGGDFEEIDNIPRRGLVHIDSSYNVSLVDFKLNTAGIIYYLQKFNDKILVSGYFTTIGGKSRNNLAIIDINTNQVLDIDFNVGGKILRITPANDSLAYVAFDVSSTIDSIVYINTNTMERVSGFTGVRITGGISDMAIFGDSLIFGGDFTQVNGNGRGKLAAINRLNGSLLPWDPSANHSVGQIEVYKDNILVRGYFTHIGGQARTHFAVLSPQTGGALPPNYNFSQTDGMEIHGGSLYIQAYPNNLDPLRAQIKVINLDTWLEISWPLHIYGNIDDFCFYMGRMYCVGSIEMAGNIEAKNLAEISMNTGRPKEIAGGTDKAVKSSHLRNGVLYFAGKFGQVGDSIRNNAAAIHLANETILPWNPMEPQSSPQLNVIKSYKDQILLGGFFYGLRNVNYDHFALVDTLLGNGIKELPTDGRILTVEYDDTFMYVGGHYSTMMGQSRNNIAQLGFNSLEPTTWQPNPNGPVLAITIDGPHVYVGGKFSNLAGVNRSNIAQLYLITGAATSWNHDLSDSIYSIRSVNDSILSIAGKFYHSSNNLNWKWIYKNSPQSLPMKRFAASYSVYGDIRFKNYTIGYGEFTDLRYNNPQTTDERYLAFFHDCIMPVKPQIIGDTFNCVNTTHVLQLSNPILNDAENWSWSQGICSSTGTEGEVYSFKESSAWAKTVYVRPIGECSTPDYCTPYTVYFNPTTYLNLTVRPCANEYPYEINGKFYPGPGAYKDTLVNSRGCDSFLNITIKSQKTDSVSLVINDCDSSWIKGKWQTQSGIYADTLVNKNGCDSIVYIDLRLNFSVYSTIDISACGSYPFGGKTLSSDGTYYDTLVADNGCDSVIQLNLTILPVYSKIINITACNVYDFYGQSLSSSGNYQKVFLTQSGCDSVIKLALTIIPLQAVITQKDAQLTAAPAGATKYLWLDCNAQYNPVSPNSTSITFKPTINGNYTVEITKGVCIDTAICYQVTNVGIESVSPKSFKLYPNPNSSENSSVKVETDLNNPIDRIIISTLLGKEVSQHKLSADDTFPVSGLAPGTYLIYVFLENEEVYSEKLIILP